MGVLALHAGKVTGWANRWKMLKVFFHSFFTYSHPPVYFHCCAISIEFQTMFRGQDAMTEVLTSLFPIGRFLLAIHSATFPEQDYKYCKDPVNPGGLLIYMPMEDDNGKIKPAKCPFVDESGQNQPAEGKLMTERDISGPDDQRMHRHQVEVSLPLKNWEKVKKAMKQGKKHITHLTRSTHC